MDSAKLSEFVESVCSESHLRVEEDLGDGFVRLRVEEAQRRQAAQDIRSSEDVVIEMLRNSRDAGARHIFIATGAEGGTRTLVMVDDGLGIPEGMHERVFEPCVTSKLDTVHMDKWGIHGRGMALYSIKENTEDAHVCCSQVGRGCSIKVLINQRDLPEKSDQSTFPQLSFNDAGKVVMRGPKNILRTAAEFSLEHRRSVDVYLGSAAEVVATLYHFGLAGKSAASLAFSARSEDQPLVKSLSFAADASELASESCRLGLEISERSAYRILEGRIKPLDSMLERLEGQGVSGTLPQSLKGKRTRRKRGEAPSFMSEDLEALSQAVSSAFADLAPAYYLSAQVSPRVTVEHGSLRIVIPLVENDE